MSKKEKFFFLEAMIIIVLALLPLLYIPIIESIDGNEKENDSSITMEGKLDIFKVLFTARGTKVFIIIFPIVLVILLVYTTKQLFPLIFGQSPSNQIKFYNK